MNLRLPFVMLFIAGCALPVWAPRFAPVTPAPADKATVYVYRTADFIFNGYPEIFLNGEQKFRLYSGGYGVFILPPGEYEIKAEGSGWTNWRPLPAIRPLAVEAGREYYVRVIPLLPSGLKAGPLAKDDVWRTQIMLVPKERALREITGTQLSQ